jgi:hypothetical protein
VPGGSVSASAGHKGGLQGGRDWAWGALNHGGASDRAEHEGVGHRQTARPALELEMPMTSFEKWLIVAFAIGIAMLTLATAVVAQSFPQRVTAITSLFGG